MKTETEVEPKALSSVDGKSWHDGSRFPWPEEPDPAVKRIALGSLEDGGAIELDDETRAGLAEVEKHFPELTHLHLWSLENLERVDGLPKGLECLDVRKCGALTEIGPVHPGLETLDLGNCVPLESLPEGDLASLRYVWLDGCRSLKKFAPLRPALDGLKTLVLHGCRFRDLDTVLCGESKEDVAEPVRAYFAALESQGVETLAECKVVVLGNGGVGKTELVRALKGLDFHEDQGATEGIHLWHWDGGGFAPFPEADVESVDLNVWDFGGQDLYHNTHRLFLESKAIFVVVWRRPRPDGKPFREDFPEDPVRPRNYWLDQVFGADREGPRVVLVQTAIDEAAEVPAEPPEDRLREEYRELPTFEVSAKERNLGNLPKLRDWIREAVREELGGAEAVRMPRGRVAVRRRLADWQPGWEEEAEPVDSECPVLGEHEFGELVEKTYSGLGLGEPGAGEVRWLLDYLHDSGAVYAPPKWIEGAPSPGAFPVIVDQRWAIDGIYALIHEAGRGRDTLNRARGRVNHEALEEIWSEITDASGAPRYDETAQWVMTQFMQSCGLLVSAGEKLIAPEFLVDRPLLEEDYFRDPLVEATIGKRDPAPRTYLMRDRALGQGFGCLVVGLMVKRFGNVPLFKYGGIGRVTVGDRWEETEKDIVVRVEWAREVEDSFQGDIVVTVFGDPENDAEVLDFLGGVLREMPGFPRGLEFEEPDGAMPAFRKEPMPALRLPETPAGFPGEPAARPEGRAQKRLGLIGLSAAGEDEDHPGLDLWPMTIQRLLEAVPDHSIEVLYYKTDRDRKTMNQLVAELATSDLMLAVIGRKYLDSEYCMVEFLEAARFFQPKVTFETPRKWTERIWPLFLQEPEAAKLLVSKSGGKGKGSDASKDWVDEWVRRATDHYMTMIDRFGDEETAEADARKEYVFDPWMRFARKSRKALRHVLAALRDFRREDWIAAVPPAGLAGEALPTWADKEAAPLVALVVDRLREIIGDLTPGEHAERCLRFWEDGRKLQAFDAFERWLGSHENPGQMRAEALKRTRPLPETNLEPVREYWCGHQRNR